MRNSKTEDNEGDEFIYRSYNTGYFPRKRVIYVSEPENIEINYDYCGCESKLVPCGILQSTFLNEISNADMKREYIRIFEDHSQSHLNRGPTDFCFYVLFTATLGFILFKVNRPFFLWRNRSKLAHDLSAVFDNDLFLSFNSSSDPFIFFLKKLWNVYDYSWVWG